MLRRRSAWLPSEIRADSRVNVSFADPGHNTYVSVSGTAQLVRPQVTDPEVPAGTAMQKLTLREALRDAMAEEMRREARREVRAAMALFSGADADWRRQNPCADCSFGEKLEHDIPFAADMARVKSLWFEIAGTPE